MDQFVKNFAREAPGVWACMTWATLELPSGRVQIAPGTRLTRGTLYMGVDLAKFLDDEFEKIPGR